MVSGRKIIDAAVSDELLLGLCVFIAGFALVQVSGMTALVSEGAMRALHRPPALIAVSVLCLQALLRTAALLKDRSAGGRGRGRVTSGLLFHLGLILVTGGVLLSSLYRFEGTMVLAEGQVSGHDGIDYTEGSLYRRKFAVPPDTNIEMLSIEPTIYNRGRSLWNVKAQMSVTSRGWPAARTVRSNSLFPSLVDGAFVSVSAFGYAPHYQISDPSGEVLDEAYAMLKLFPPGTEDSFAMKFLPITYYVQYFPDGLPLTGQDPSTAGRPPGPVYRVRAARNLDLLLRSTALAAGERASLQPEMISFLDAPRWAEIRIVKDYGLFLILPGICVMLASVAWGRYAWTAGLRSGGHVAGQAGRRQE